MMKFTFTLISCFLFLRLTAQCSEPHKPQNIFSSLVGASPAKNVIVDSTGVFVSFESANFYLLFSQSVKANIEGHSCTFAATVFVVSMRPETVLAITGFGDYVQADLKSGSVTAEIDGTFFSFSNPVHSNE